VRVFLAVPVLALAACSSVSTSARSVPHFAVVDASADANVTSTRSFVDASAASTTTSADASFNSSAAPTSSVVAPAMRAGDNLNTAEKSNRVSVYLGGRSLDEDDYDPVDRQGVLGIEFARETPGSGIGWEVGVFASAKEDDVAGIDVEGSTREIYAGLRKSFGDQIIRPVIGVGAALINSKIDGNGQDDDDSSLAAYAHVGIGADVSPSVTLGLDLRFLFGSDLELGGVDTDADYGQLAFFVGFAF